MRPHRGQWCPFKSLKYLHANIRSARGLTVNLSGLVKKPCTTMWNCWRKIYKIVIFVNFFTIQLDPPCIMSCKPGNTPGSGEEKTFTWEKNSGIQRVRASETCETGNLRPPSSLTQHPAVPAGCAPGARPVLLQTYSHTHTYKNIYSHTPK